MDKYDRQLRLWGNEGQELLAKARICIVGKSFLSEEILKNLLLPGSSRFTLIAERYGYNEGFFDPQAIQKLNPGAEIKTVIWNDDEMRNDSYWTRFDLVVVCTTEVQILNSLSTVKLPPTLICYTIGFSGYVRFVSAEPHFVIDSHAQHATPDLRLSKPWEELKEFLKSFDITTLDECSITNLPYVVIIYQALLRIENRGSVVSRDSLRKEIHDIQTVAGEGGNGPNFREAERFSYLATLDSKQLPENLVRCFKLLEKNVEIPFNHHIKDLLRCLKTYLANDYSKNQLPLSGIIPDMTSSTENYNRLKQLYLKRANDDLEQFSSFLYETEVPVPCSITNTFCKNTRQIRVVEPSDPFSCELFVSPVMNQSSTTAHMTNTLRMLLNSQYNRSTDPHRNKEAYQEHFKSRSNNSDQTKHYPIISFIAGIAAQESVKLITHQYVPIENTFVYDGITNQSCTLKL